jgi:Arylsulfotransferase (ASST)
MDRSVRRRGSKRRTWSARVALCALTAGVAPAVVGLSTAPPASAVGSPYALVSVSGAPLGGLAVAPPYGLNPAFSPATTDYDVQCQSGTNAVSLTLTGSGGPLSVGTNQQATAVSGQSVTVPLSVTPNQAIVIYAPATGGATGLTQYWIRCLPPGFPTFQVNQAGPASPGWTPGYYFTGNITSTNGTSYAIALDGNGVPVWYQQVAAHSGGAVNVELLPNDTIAWTGNPTIYGIGIPPTGDPYSAFDLDTQSLSSLPAAVPPTDEHELTPLPNGDRLMISTPIESHDLTGLGPGSDFFHNETPASVANNTISDCIVQEVNQANQAVWTWDAAQHIGLDEINTYGSTPTSGPAWGLIEANGAPAADLYHCNSLAMDEDPSSPWFGDVLVSMRHLNAVLLVDPATGDVVWKLGGTAFTANDPEVGQGVPAQHLAITGDDETQFCGQHDARFVPTPDPTVEDVSVFDDHTNCTGAARGVEYALDLGASTATPDYQYVQPQNLQSLATGSFRRMPDTSNDIGSGTSVIGWGITTFTPGFTEVDGAGNVLCDIRFSDGDFLYRAIKVDASQVNLSLLRQTAGWTGSAIPPPPAAPPGPAPGGIALNSFVLGMAATPDSWGYWQVAGDGGVFSYGDAQFYGSAGGMRLNKPVVGMAATPDGAGYWLVASDGGIFNYGDAAFLGSAGGTPLNKPVVGMAATPDGGGYWLVASDGGVFTYGDAQFYGSSASLSLNAPVNGMASTANGNGYWLTAADGGIFNYGDAGFFGSAGGRA